MMINDWNNAAVRKHTYTKVSKIYLLDFMYSVGRCERCLCLSSYSFSKRTNCNVVKVYFRFLSEAHKPRSSCIFILHHADSKVSFIGNKRNRTKIEKVENINNSNNNTEKYSCIINNRAYVLCTEWRP